MKKFVIIVAGGAGKRMGTATPKQFLNLSGKPLLFHSISRFYEFSSYISIIVVLPEVYFKTWEELIQSNGFNIPHNIIPGGKERFDSVKNGLEYVEDGSLVAIHDGVRPLVSNEVIERTFRTAEKHGNAIPVLQLNESVRQVTDAGNIPVDRSKLFSVQTPQVFHSDILKKAYNQPFSEYFTDDAMVVETLGIKINLVDGDPINIKITSPVDMRIAEALIVESWNR